MQVFYLPPEGEGGAKRRKENAATARFTEMRPTANEFANTAARRLRQTPSDAECALWQVLRAGRAGEPRFRRQLPIDRYIADFACLRERLVVEVDGSQHADQMAYDAARTQRLEALGFRVVRFWAGDVLRSPSEIVDAIWAVVHASRNERVKKNMSTDRVR